MAQTAGEGSGQVSAILANGVFSAGGSGFMFPVIAGQNLNYDEIRQTGTDGAIASLGGVAANTKTITKNQNANGGIASGFATTNYERILISNQWATSTNGGSRATNTFTMTTNQQ
jgi:hypothetical protein